MILFSGFVSACASQRTAGTSVKDENKPVKNVNESVVSGSYILSGAASATKDDVKAFCVAFGDVAVEQIGEGVFSLQFGERNDPGLTELESRLKKSTMFKSVQPNYKYKALPGKGQKKVY